MARPALTFGRTQTPVRTLDPLPHAALWDPLHSDGDRQCPRSYYGCAHDLEDGVKACMTPAGLWLPCNAHCPWCPFLMVHGSPSTSLIIGLASMVHIASSSSVWGLWGPNPSVIFIQVDVLSIQSQLILYVQPSSSALLCCQSFFSTSFQLLNGDFMCSNPLFLLAAVMLPSMIFLSKLVMAV